MYGWVYRRLLVANRTRAVKIFQDILQSSIRKMLEVIYWGLDLDQGFLELRLPPGQPGLCPSTLDIWKKKLSFSNSHLSSRWFANLRSKYLQMIQWRWMCSRGFSCCWSQLTMVQALWPGKCLATFCCSWSKRERQTIKCPPQSIPNRQPRHRNLFLLPISLFIGFDKGWFTYHNQEPSTTQPILEIQPFREDFEYCFADLVRKGG